MISPRLIFLLLAPIFAGLNIACAGRKFERVHPSEIIDLSGRWNDSDARLTAQEMIAKCLSHPWLREAELRLSRKPVLIVGRIRNESYEHINTGILVEQFQDALLYSKRVMFVANADEREEVRAERADQRRGESTDKRRREEIVADFILSGVIGSVDDKDGKQKVIYYQVNLKLLDIKSTEIVWEGQKKIKKTNVGFGGL